MTNAAEIADRYIALWNETDAGLRRELITQTWTETARYIDPMMQGEGHDGIDTMIAGVQQQFPGHRFSLVGQPDGHADRIRFSWKLAADGAPAVAQGTDFAIVAADGRLEGVTGFLDQVAA
ncbi:nuclear transport factor 2 family protein [Rhodospirillaceae bacterium SYSU D60014]|uniref:nuclear transport factor 2 family protein n=1 Tax=Virgifigura deserti TaxID=2268457 RepID=UPI000E6680D4